MADDKSLHFNQKQRRKAEIINPPNRIKQKVGHGGITDEILNKAQDLLESVSVDFPAMAEMHLDSLSSAISYIRQVRSAGKKIKKDAEEELINSLIYPAMQLKAHGGMFKYDLVTRIADNMIHFLEVVRKMDDDAMEIIEAHNTTLRAIVHSKISGNGGKKGKALLGELHEACRRYFSKYGKPGQN